MTEPENASQWRTRRLVIGLGVVVAVFLAVIAAGYLFHLTWTGLVPYEGTPHEKDTHYQPGKNLWDWLQLLIIPVALAVVGVWFNGRQKQYELETAQRNRAADREIADRNREADLEKADAQRQDQILATYIDRMQDLLEKSQRAGAPGVTVLQWMRSAARARTVTAIRQLDSEHNAALSMFLAESQLLANGEAEIDLSETVLVGSQLARAFLFRANLGYASLRDAALQGAYLVRANLEQAILLRANLRRANLEKANLSGAWVTDAQLKQADSLDDATMPDGRTFQGWDGQSYETDEVKKRRAEGTLQEPA